MPALAASVAWSSRNVGRAVEDLLRGLGYGLFTTKRERLLPFHTDPRQPILTMYSVSRRIVRSSLTKARGDSQAGATVDTGVSASPSSGCSGLTQLRYKSGGRGGVVPAAAWHPSEGIINRNSAARSRTCARCCFGLSPPTGINISIPDHRQRHAHGIRAAAIRRDGPKSLRVESPMS